MSADDGVARLALQREGGPNLRSCPPPEDGSDACESNPSNVVRLNRDAEPPYYSRTSKLRATIGALSRSAQETSSSRDHTDIGGMRTRVSLFEDYQRNRRAAQLDLISMEGSPTGRATVLTAIETYPTLEAPTALQKHLNSKSGVELASSTLKSLVAIVTSAAGAMTGIAVEKVFDAQARLVIAASIGVFCSVIGFSTLLNLWVSRSK